MQLNPSEISELIRAKIQNLPSSTEVRTTGTVVSVTDGIVRVHGLADVMQGEMLEFPGNTFGLAMNLERARHVRRTLILVQVDDLVFRRDRASRVLGHQAPSDRRFVT